MAHMTNGQINTLRTFALSNGTTAPLIAAGNAIGFMNWCNTASGSNRWLPMADTLSVEEAPSYTSYDTLTQGKRDSWMLFLKNSRDFGKAKVRNWVTDIWGNATANSNSEAVLLAGTTSATNAQVAIGGTIKTTGTVSAVDTSFEELVDINDASRVIFKDDGTIWTL